MRCLCLEGEDTLLCKGKETSASQDTGAEQSPGLYAAQSYNPEQVIGEGSLQDSLPIRSSIPLVSLSPPNLAMSRPLFMDPYNKLALAKAFMTYCVPLPLESILPAEQ